MVIRNKLIGGQRDWRDGNVLFPADLNDTFDEYAEVTDGWR
jgi:hypothetical protein